MDTKSEKDKIMDKKKPFGQAYIPDIGTHRSGFRIVYDPYKFKKGKNKGKIQCFYRHRKGYKKIILREDQITPIKEFQNG